MCVNDHADTISVKVKPGLGVRLILEAYPYPRRMYIESELDWTCLLMPLKTGVRASESEIGTAGNVCVNGNRC